MSIKQEELLEIMNNLVVKFGEHIYLERYHGSFIYLTLRVKTFNYRILSVEIDSNRDEIRYIDYNSIIKHLKGASSSGLIKILFNIIKESMAQIHSTQLNEYIELNTKLENLYRAMEEENVDSEIN